MIKKELEKNIKVVPYGENTGIKDSIELEYYLTESEIHESEELYGEKVFGVEIVKIMDGKEMEAKTVLDLSCNKENTIGILNKLANNTVTPMSLQFVLEDIIGV
jgi:hypothetical protein